MTSNLDTAPLADAAAPPALTPGGRSAMRSLLVVTGYGMVFLRGGFGVLSAAQWVMVVLGTAMVALALYIFFVPFLRMRAAVLRSQWPAACAQAGQIRWLSAVNIVLAVPTVLSGVWAIFGAPF